jgi:hypothetical protein
MVEYDTRLLAGQFEFIPERVDIFWWTSLDNYFSKFSVFYHLTDKKNSTAQASPEHAGRADPDPVDGCRTRRSRRPACRRTRPWRCSGAAADRRPAGAAARTGPGRAAPPARDALPPLPK